MEYNIENELVKHNYYGIGQIIAYDGKHILVKFENEEMGFAFPEAFAEHLQFVNASIQSMIDDELCKFKKFSYEKWENRSNNTKLDKNRIEIAKAIDKYIEKNGTDTILTNQQILELIKEANIIPDVMYLSSDLCYNKTNAANLGTFKTDIHLYKYISRGTYQVLGSNYPYTGKIEWKKAKDPNTYCLGRWEEGNIVEWHPDRPILFENSNTPNMRNEYEVVNSKYSKLTNYLLINNNDRIELSFSKLEEILEFSLPMSARKYVEWWNNYDSTHVQCQAWNNVGFRVSVNLVEEKVIFIKDRL